MFLALAFWSVGTGFIPSCTNTEHALPADRSGILGSLSGTAGSGQYVC